MNGETIKSFLVGLGFGVDETSLSKFYKAIDKASIRVAALYASIKIAAAGIFWSISKVSEGFEQMGYEYRIIAPAINKALVLRRELLKAYAAAGINITKVVQQSVKFNMALAKTGFALKAIYASTASKFFPLLTQQMDIFRGKIYANMPKIIAMLEKFVAFVFKAFEATVILGTRVWSILQRIYDFFYTLHRATDGWSTVVLGLVAAWKFLNLAFIATPLGALLTGFVAILALYDDFMTFVEGGESLINWKPLIPIIDGVKDSFKALWEVVKGVWKALGYIGQAFYNLFKGDFDAALQSLVGLFDTLLETLGKVYGFLGSILNLSGRVAGYVASLFGGENGAKNIAAIPGASQGAQPRPLGVGNTSNQTNMSVHQQTEINVTGSADANAIGKSVAGEQSRVNFDLVRNMKGATR